MTPEEKRKKATVYMKQWRAKNPRPLTEEQLIKNRERGAKWRARNPEKVKAKSAKDGKTGWRIRPWTRCLGVRQAHAKKRSILFTLKSADVRAVWTGKCAITGLPFDLRAGKGAGPRPFSPSLDRVKPGRGYVPGNVRFILQCVNAFKSTMTDALMAKVAARIVQA